MNIRVGYVLCAMLLGVSPGSAQAQDEDQSIEDLLLGTWLVEERVLEFANATARQINGKVHITERNDDGTYRVLVTLSTHLKKREGEEGQFVDCQGKDECTTSSATEGVGRYVAGRFMIDYYAENWYDDVFTIDGLTMNGADPNGPIVLQKVVED